MRYSSLHGVSRHILNSQTEITLFTYAWISAQLAQTNALLTCKFQHNSPDCTLSGLKLFHYKFLISIAFITSQKNKHSHAHILRTFI